jgi:hypothetical protein
MYIEVCVDIIARIFPYYLRVCQFAILQDIYRNGGHVHMASEKGNEILPLIPYK